MPPSTDILRTGYVGCVVARVSPPAYSTRRARRIKPQTSSTVVPSSTSPAQPVQNHAQLPLTKTKPSWLGQARSWNEKRDRRLHARDPGGWERPARSSTLPYHLAPPSRSKRADSVGRRDDPPRSGSMTRSSAGARIHPGWARVRPSNETLRARTRMAAFDRPASSPALGDPARYKGKVLYSSTRSLVG